MRSFIIHWLLYKLCRMNNSLSFVYLKSACLVYYLPLKVFTLRLFLLSRVINLVKFGPKMWKLQENEGSIWFPKSDESKGTYRSRRTLESKSIFKMSQYRRKTIKLYMSSGYFGRSRGGGGTVDYFQQFCAISKVPMVLIKENIC